MVFDCFTFFNELELLEIRLHELNEVVDRFVLVEATRTFQKESKPLYFTENKGRFRPFLHKIEHVVVDRYPGFFARWRVPTPWDYEDSQREGMLKGLTGCKPDDLVIVSDVDEIPRASRVLEYKDRPEAKVFRQKLFCYYLDCFVVDCDAPAPFYNGYKPWEGPVMCRYDQIRSIKEVRKLTDAKPGAPGILFVEEGGWHYSFLGGAQRIVQKIEAYAHKEHNKRRFKDPRRIEQLIRAGKDLFDGRFQSRFVRVDEDCPEYMRRNLARFEHLVLRPSLSDSS